MQLESMGIVGAGPGGLATAALAAMSGICKNIVVMDRLPEGAVGCGVSVPTEYVQWIATIAPPLKDLLDLPITGMRYDRYYAEGYEFTVDSECYYSGVERSALLLYLKTIARDRGVEISYQTEIRPEDVAGLGFSLIVGADGPGSVVRKSDPSFEMTTNQSSNQYLWVALDRCFDGFVHGYNGMNGGMATMRIYHTSPNSSAAVIEIDTKMFDELHLAGSHGADDIVTQATLDVFQDMFAPLLGGARFGSRNSRWRNPFMSKCNRATSENIALVGDAYMVLYFGRGQGTEKAVSDAEALVTSIREARRLPEALVSYQNKFVYHDEDHRAGLALMMEKPSQGVYYHQLGPEKFMREYEAAIRAAIEAGAFG